MGKLEHREHGQIGIGLGCILEKNSGSHRPHRDGHLSDIRQNPDQTNMLNKSLVTKCCLN